MTDRNDDDTSAGAITQGGSAPRRGHSLWWVMAAGVVIVAILVGVLTLPKKQAPAERGTSPVSTGMTVAAPGGVAPSAVPSQTGVVTAPTAKP